MFRHMKCSCSEQKWACSPEYFRVDGRLQDEDDHQERKKQEAAQREKSHLENLPTVGAERKRAFNGT